MPYYLLCTSRCVLRMQLSDAAPNKRISAERSVAWGSPAHIRTMVVSFTPLLRESCSRDNKVDASAPWFVRQRITESQLASRLRFKRPKISCTDEPQPFALTCWPWLFE